MWWSPREYVALQLSGCFQDVLTQDLLDYLLRRVHLIVWVTLQSFSSVRSLRHSRWVIQIVLLRTFICQVHPACLRLLLIVDHYEVLVLCRQAVFHPVRRELGSFAESHWSLVSMSHLELCVLIEWSCPFLHEPHICLLLQRIDFRVFLPQYFSCSFIGNCWRFVFLGDRELISTSLRSCHWLGLWLVG